MYYIADANQDLVENQGGLITKINCYHFRIIILCKQKTLNKKAVKNLKRNYFIFSISTFLYF